MSFFKAIAEGFRNYFSISGRANRRAFWFWIAFCAIILVLALIIDGMLIAPMRGFLPFEGDAGQPLSAVLLALLVLPTITAAVRRLHDSNMAGWWLAVFLLIPVVHLACQIFLGTGYNLRWILEPLTIASVIPLAYYLIKGAKKGENRFGD